MLGQEKRRSAAGPVPEVQPETGANDDGDVDQAVLSREQISSAISAYI